MNRVWTESLVRRESTTTYMLLSNGVKLRITASHPHVVDHRRKLPFGYDTSTTDIAVRVGYSDPIVKFDAHHIDNLRLSYPLRTHPILPVDLVELARSGLLQEDDRTGFADACRLCVTLLGQEMERLLGA